MDPADIRDLMQEMTSTAVDMSEEQMTTLNRCCTIIEEITSDHCKALIRASGVQPCLQTFMSDGWSTDIRTRASGQSQGVSVQRTGRLRTEFLIQRTIVKAVVDQEMKMAFKIERPRPLGAKKCNDIFSAACDHCYNLKLQGHRGISISVYLQDGLMAAPFEKRMKARHNMFFADRFCPLIFEDPADKDLCELKDWCLAWCCVAHSCSKALKWGLKEVTESSEMLESVHISISSLLRASTGIHQAIPLFLIRMVVFDRAPAANPTEVEQFWAMLDIEPGKLDLFVEVNPYWDGKVLHVNSALLTDSDSSAKIRTLLLTCLFWTDFSETRWTKVGLSGRLYTRSLLVGVDGLVKITEESDAVNRYHLAGYFKRATKSVRVYLATAAVAGRPSESMLFDVLQDDRFLQRIDSCRQILEDEVQYLLAAPNSYYETVAEAVKITATEYRSHCVNCALTSISYLHQDIWVPLSSPPWMYFVGNCQDNIAKLKGDESVTEPLSVKMRTLALIGFDSEVVSACYLVQETSMSTTLAEQFHGSGAQIMRRHPQLQTEALMARLTVHHSRTLFQPDYFEKKEAELRAIIDDIDRRIGNAKHTGPRQMYTKMLVSHSKAGAAGGVSHHAIRRSVFKHHNTGFSKLAPNILVALRSKASAHISAQRQVLADDRQHVLGQLELLRIRQRQFIKDGLVNHMDRVRFVPADFLKFSELWSQYPTLASMKQLQAPPKPMTASTVRLFEAEIEKLPVVPRTRPDWLSTVVNNRQGFSSVGFFSDSQHPDGSVLFVLLLAMGQPHRAVFLRCERCRGPERGEAVRRYQYDDLVFVTEADVPFLRGDDTWVVPLVQFRAMHIHAMGEPVPFSIFSRFLPASASTAPAQRARTSIRGPTSPEVFALLLQEFPWLSRTEMEDLLNNKKRRVEDGDEEEDVSPAGGARGSADGPADIPEDVVASLAQELADLRAEYEGFDEEGTYFTVRVLGGEWSIKKKGVPCTDVGAYALEKSTEGWCKGVGWPARKSFAVRKHGGVSNARKLAEEMCRRGNFFMKSWVDAGCVGGFDFQLVKAAYKAPNSYEDWVDTLVINSDAFVAAMDIRDLCPIPVPV